MNLLQELPPGHRRGNTHTNTQTERDKAGTGTASESTSTSATASASAASASGSTSASVSAAASFVVYRWLCISRRVCRVIILFLVILLARSFVVHPFVHRAGRLAWAPHNDLPLALLSQGINFMANIHSSTHCWKCFVCVLCRSSACFFFVLILSLANCKNYLWP